MKHTCLVCGGKMKHLSEKDWLCTECGAEAWMGENGTLCFDAEYFDDDDVDADGIPMGCSACGGPYPFCTTSCPMFDD